MNPVIYNSTRATSGPDIIHRSSWEFSDNPTAQPSPFTSLLLGLVARKPVFGVPDKASFKPVSSATETT